MEPIEHLSMPTKKRQLGNRGEELAKQYLINKGYTIIKSNWHCPYGELDIIARKAETIVFVEVKTRHSSNTEAAFAGITADKQQKLIATAHAYLNTYEHHDETWRIDAIAIALPTQQQPIIEHVEDVIGW